MINRKMWMILAILTLALVSVAGAEEAAPEQSGAENTWTGLWQSELFTINFTQNEDVVSGPYVSINPGFMITGFIEGTLSEDGNTLLGTWTETGDLAFTLSDDASSFTGTWGYNETLDAVAENITGSWAGTWNSVNYSLNFAQDGDAVTGAYTSINPEFIDETGVIEGTVSEDQKVLTGTWTDSGEITFVIGADGSVFNGTWSYGSAQPGPGNVWNATRIA